MTWRMPAEWEPHTRTWMAWPCHPDTMEASGGPDVCHRAWAAVAKTVAEFEPVTMACRPADVVPAWRVLGDGITIAQMDLGDGWMRDTGPTFVVSDDGRLGAVDWSFNGWGGRTFPEAQADALVARNVAELAGAERIASRLVNEGGGIHVDGAGTVLLTETVQLSPARNPNWTKAEVEAEVHARLGTSKAIWMPRGCEDDYGPYGTDGHIDGIAAFVRPGVVVVHGQPDPAHPDFELARENAAILRAETDAQGRALEVVVLDAPRGIDIDGETVGGSYVNFAFVNAGVVLCAFDDPERDAATVEIFQRLCPDRRIVTAPALELFMGGGGVHCITQHEPRVG